MSVILSLFSSFVTVLPAAIFLWMFISIVAGNEYYWMSYFIVSGVYLVVSLALGFFVPALAPVHWKRHPILWLFGQGMLAWLVAILALGLVNLTPLCVGQDNGDGNNDFALCMAQTVMVPIVCSPLEFILLCLTALPSSWIIKGLVKSEVS
jgi:hypothetical protein